MIVLLSVSSRHKRESKLCRYSSRLSPIVCLIYTAYQLYINIGTYTLIFPRGRHLIILHIERNHIIYATENQWDAEIKYQIKCVREGN